MSSMLKSFCQVAHLTTEQQLNGRQEGNEEVVKLALFIILDYWNALIQDAVSTSGRHTEFVAFGIPRDQVPPFFLQLRSALSVLILSIKLGALLV